MSALPSTCPVPVVANWVDTFQQLSLKDDPTWGTARSWMPPHPRPHFLLPSLPWHPFLIWKKVNPADDTVLTLIRTTSSAASCQEFDLYEELMRDHRRRMHHRSGSLPDRYARVLHFNVAYVCGSCDAVRRLSVTHHSGRMLKQLVYHPVSRHFEFLQGWSICSMRHTETFDDECRIIADLEEASPRAATTRLSVEPEPALAMAGARS